MTLDQLGAGQIEILRRIDQLYAALVIMLALGLVFMLIMAVLAAWSVQTVNRMQEHHLAEIDGQLHLLFGLMKARVEDDAASDAV